MRRAISRQRHNDATPPKPDFMNQNELKLNTDGGFDEADRKKFEQLAEPFLNEVENLPKILQETINSNHSKNAESLVLNKQDLREATEMLGEIQAKLIGALEEAQATRKKEQAVSDKLRSIDLNNDKDTKVITNRQKVAELLREIYKDASIPEDEKGLLENPDFRTPQKIDEVFQAVLKLTREVEKNETPPSLVGLDAASERITLCQNLLNEYAKKFVEKIERELSNLKILGAIVSNDPPVDYIPPSVDELFIQNRPVETEEAKEGEKSETSNPESQSKSNDNKEKDEDNKENKEAKDNDDDKDGSESDDDEDNDSEKSANDDDSDKSDSDNENNDGAKSKKHRHHHHKKSSSKKHSKSSGGKKHRSSKHSRNSKEISDKKMELKSSSLADPDDPRKKFSIPEVAYHPLLKYINRFWKHIRWIQKYHYEDCYLILQKSYISCSNKYLKDVVCSKFYEEISTSQSIKRSQPVPTDPFATDDEYKTQQSDRYVVRITEVLSTLFNNFRKESCILTEFWGITDPQTMSKIIPDNLLQYMRALIEMIKNFDNIYLIVVRSICAREEETSLIPIKHIVDVPRKEWNAVIKEQVDSMKSIKLSKSKDTVFKVFQDVPEYIKALIHITPKQGTKFLEKTISIILEEIVSYVTENAIPKGTKKSKAARLIIVNLVYLTEALNKEPFLLKSDLIRSRMNKIDEVLNDNVKIFLESMAEKAWPEPYQFFYQIDEWMQQEGFTYEIVTFQVTHTPEKFKEMNEKIDKKINISISDCHAFLKKKIKTENLRNELKKSVVSNIANIFQRWSDLAEKCYGTKLITTREKVTQLMQNYQKA